MLHRRFFVVMLLGVGLWMAWVFAPAAAQQEQNATAEQLFQQGMQQYGQGDFSGAKATLDKVDPVQLSKEHRVALQEMLQDIERQSANVSAPEAASPEAPPEAPAAEEAPPAAPAEEPAAPAAAPDPRKTNPDLGTARDRIDQAAADLDAGNLDTAEAALQAVRAQDAQLGHWDKSRVDSLVELLAQKRAMAPAPAVEAPTAVVEAPPAEPLAVPAPAEPAPAPEAPVVAQAEPEAPAAVEPAPEAPAAVEPAPAAPAAVEPAPEAPAAVEAAPEAPVAEAPVAEAPAAEAPVAEAPAPEAPAAEAPPVDDLLAQARVIRAQEKAAEADAASQNGQHLLAVRLYEQALALDASNEHAAAGLAAAQAKRDQALAPQDVLTDLEQTNRLRAESAVAEYRELINTANAQLATRNFSAASNAVQQALVVLDNNTRYLPTADYRKMRDEATALSARIDTSRQSTEDVKRAADAQKQAEDAETERRQALDRTQAEVDRLLRRALNLRREQKYENALELVNQVLFLDPNNVAADAMKEMIEEARVVVSAREFIRQRARQIANQAVENTAATIPYTELITYPADWPQLTARRLADLEEGAGETEVNRRVMLKLRDPVPINFEANRLVNVIDYLRNTTGLNFFVNWPALQAAGIEQDTPITLQLTNIPAEQALRLVLQQAAAGQDLEAISFSVVEGIVTVSTVTDLQKVTMTRVYDIRDMLVQISNFSEAPEFDLNTALSNTNSGGSNTNDTGGGGGGGGTGGGQSLFNTEAEEEPEVSRDELVTALKALIQDSVGRADEWQENGGEVSSIRELNGNFIIRTTPENHRDIVKLLSDLRITRAMQIHVETRFLLVDQNFLDEFGIDLDAQINNVGGNFGPIKIAQDSFTLASRQNTGLPGSFGLSSGTGAGIGSFAPGTGFPATGHSLDIGVTFLDDLQVNLIVRATQASRYALTLTAPRITLFNGQRAFVLVATQQAFVSDLTPIPDTAGFDPTLSVVQSGVVLDVEGTISADRRYVTMTVRPSLARVNEIRQIPQTAIFDPEDPNDPAQVVSAVIEAPLLELTQLMTTASVPDKGTLLLGGQRLYGEIEVEAGVPILSKIPFINRLFTNTSHTKDQRTLLVLVKPTIILQNEEEENLFPGLMENPAQYNAGRQPR